ncbi:uncharacterized protein [Lepeophtheirus salmonis]|uniref:uncharacterized protein isoform X3 n=1 Tax=Lepeophtheirus salmonis TaxID=72036 RepID=UPI003AF35B75
MEKLRRRNAPSLLEWSRSLRFTLSDPNFSVCPVSITWDNPGSSRNASSLLYLKRQQLLYDWEERDLGSNRNGLARKLGLKFMALRGGAVYLSTEAFYLEIKENGEEILHILNPESIEILPRGGDLVAHLKGLMELKPSNWKGLSTLQDELKSILGDDLIPRVGGTPAQIRLFDNYTALSILPQNNHFVLRIRDPFPLAEEKLTELGKICGFNLFELVGPRGGYLMDLIVPDSPLFMNLPDQKHCYFLAHHLHGTFLSCVPFSDSSQIPGILSLLRQQALYNSLISSCASSGINQQTLTKSTIVFEISSLNLNQITISFENPLDESITALEIDLNRVLRTKIHSLSLCNQFTQFEHIDRVLQKFLSIPILMRTVIKYFCSRVQLNETNSVGQNCNNPDVFYSRLYHDAREGDDKFDNSSYQVDSLNEKGFQDVVCYPGANIKVCASNKLATNSSQLGFSSCLESLSSRKNNLFDERILKPCVSITPVSNTSTILQVQNTKKIGIEIIPLGSGVNSSITSKKLLNKTYRDIKRSLSEDDKRSRSLKKGKKRRHPSTLAIDKSPSLSPKNKNCTFSCSYSSKAIAKLQNKSIDSLRETIKHKSTNKNLLAPRDSSSKSLLCNTSKFFKKRNKDKEKQTQEDEVKRLLGGGKLLNKTFHIPKINTVTCLKNTEQYDNLNDKKIPSLMSLQPSIYSKESLNTTFLKSSVGYASISSIAVFF